MLDEGAYAELESYARRDGVSAGHLIREAMELYLSERERRDAGAPNPLPSFVGMVDDPSVQGEEVEDFLRDWLPIHEEGERNAPGPPTDGGPDAGGG